MSWIDINLIANDKFVSVLLKFMSQPFLRESTCDCIHEIISKGMDPLTKTKLIESFTSVLKSAGVLDVDEVTDAVSCVLMLYCIILIDYYVSQLIQIHEATIINLLLCTTVGLFNHVQFQDEEGDFLAKLAKLINGIGLQLISAWQKATKAKEVEACKIISDALESKIALMFKFLNHEDDDVSGSVAQFAHDYITHLKLSPLTESQKQNVKDLLYVVMKKMKYDDCYNFESEGEEEAMFQEYRKELKVIFNNIGALVRIVILKFVWFSTLLS